MAAETPSETPPETPSETPLDGLVVRRDAAGAVLEEAGFRAGALHGAHRLYGPGGALMREATHRDGLLDGVAVDYDDRGGALARTTWAQGRRDGPATLYVGGRRAVEMMLRDGRPDGVARVHDPSGALTATIEYRDGLRHGVMEVFRPEGGLIARSHWADDLADGPTETFDAQGRLIHRVVHAAGRKVGEEVTWADGVEIDRIDHDAPKDAGAGAAGPDPVRDFYASLTRGG